MTTDIELWNRARSDIRDALNITEGEINEAAGLHKAIRQCREKLNRATAGMLELELRASGVKPPKRGE